jgi:hypothetical protein
MKNRRKVEGSGTTLFLLMPYKSEQKTNLSLFPFFSSAWVESWVVSTAT